MILFCVLTSSFRYDKIMIGDAVLLPSSSTLCVLPRTIPISNNCNKHFTSYSFFYIYTRGGIDCMVKLSKL